jgi:hypothetical protein
MRLCARICLVAFLLASLVPVAVRAESGPPVPVRVGSHPGYGRVVFDLPDRLDYRLTQQGQRVLVRFTGDVTIGSAPSMPHNVVGLTGGAGQAELVVETGTVVHAWRLGNLVVVDVLDEALAAGGPPASVQASVPTPPSGAADGAAPGVAAAAVPPASVVVPAPSTVPAKQGPKAAAPQALAAAHSASPAQTGSPSGATGGAAPGAFLAKNAVPPTATAVPLPSAVPAKPGPKAAAPQAVAPPPAASPAQSSQPSAAAGVAAPAASVAKAVAPAASAAVRAQPDAKAVAPPPVSVEKPADTVVADKSQPVPARPAEPSVARTAQISAPPSPPESVPPVSQIADMPAPLALAPDRVLEVAFDAAVGVAAFRRGNAAFVVFDQQLPLDLASSRDDPVFGSATIQQLPTATMIHLRLEPSKALVLSQAPHLWRITVAPAELKLHPLRAIAADGRLVISTAAPGRVISLADPDTGAILLVGTQRQPGQGVPVLRRAVEFLLMPTWQGIAVEPISDDVALRPVQDGFILTGGTGGLALSPTLDAVEILARGDALTRRFDFAALPPEALLQRLRRQFADNAAAPVLGRGAGRRAAAQTMISLGLGAEAEALLQLAAADDPHEVAAADNAALTGMAAVLAHRADEASGLNDERLSGTDDIALWRAVRPAEQQDGSPQAAAVFAATLPLVLAYPSPLRDRLLPLVSETLVAGGETAAASALLAERKDDPALGLARGLLQEARGDAPAALAAYEVMAASTDRRMYARSAARALELRLAGGTIDVKQAADGLDKLLYAWRGDRHERLLRERVAELRARAGAWRSALGLIRETEAIFPDDQAAIHAELVDMFAAMLRSDASDSLPPLELTALVDENADLLPVGPAGDQLQARLADRLLALDLPKRADPVLQKLMRAAPNGVSRAGFGARLATLRLREGDAAGALAALNASNADDAPPDLVERRTLLLAAAHARLGEADQALAVLGPLDTASADEARATISERANDWPAAEKALNAYATKVVPAEGKLDDGQRRTMLRLATAAARSGDAATLTALRQTTGTRMESGPLADMFRLLTADQVRGVGDLKRSAQEAVVARELPSQLNAVQPPPNPNP